MTRHEMRQNAFILTFERLFHDDPIEIILQNAKECEEVKIDSNVEEMFRGIDQNITTLDEHIKKHLKNWTINRISKVSLAILRVAMYEILYSDLDIDIVISEAVKISQKFALKDDVSFVNGVLSSVSKERKK